MVQATRLRDRALFYNLLLAIVIALASTTGPIIGEYFLNLSDIILLTLILI